MTTVNVFRRNALKLALGTAFLSVLSSCSIIEKRPPGPIMVNTEGVHDLNTMLAAIKKSASPYLSRKLTVQDYYTAIADSVVVNARKAAEIGLKVPEWILNQLPKKVVDNSLQNLDYVTIALVGVTLLFPITIFFTIIFASLLTMSRYIKEKINEKKT